MLGISEQDIKKALGPPGGNFGTAANGLGVSVEALLEALIGN